MAFTEKISLVVDVVTGQSKTSLNRLKADLDDADGAMSKMKVGASGVGNFLSANLAAGAAAAGTAIAAFGAKAIGDFQDTALGAGKLSDSLGVTTEEASRLQEVAGDLGIGVGTLESTMGKMNKTAATTPEAFAGIGAAIAKNKDGTTDVTQTFLNAIDALNKIPDATQRAEAAQKIFGRGWQDISELVGKGAAGVREAMASVESQKIIDEEEVEQARKFRDTLDELKGVTESVSIAVGGELVDSLNDVKVILDQLKGPIEDFNGALDSIPGGDALKSRLSGLIVPARQIPALLEGAANAIEKFKSEEITVRFDATPLVDAAVAANGFESRVALMGKASRDAGLDLKDMGESATEGKAQTEAHAAAQKAAEDAVKEHSAALQEQADVLTEQADAARASVDAGFALRDAQRGAAEAATDLDDVLKDEDATMQDLSGALDKVSQAALEVADAEVRVAEEAYTAAGATLSAAQKTDIHNRSLLTQASTLNGPARAALVDHIAQLNGIPPEKASEILTLIDQGKVAEAEAVLASTSRTRQAEIDAEAKTAEAERDLNEVARRRTAQINAQYNANLGVIGANGEKRALGGPVRSGEAYLVGEKGPEVMIPKMNGTIIPNNQLATTGGSTGGINGAMGNGAAAGVTNNIVINMPAGADGRDVVRKIKEYERLNGAAWRAS